MIMAMAAVLALAPILAMCSGQSADEGNEDFCTLALWQIDSFEGGKGSRAQYLQNAADECFSGERVYVKVTSLSADAARANIAMGNVPDIISYGAGFYGIETLINSADITWACWCRGGYVLISTEDGADFSDVSSQNTVINEGRDNLSRACALIEGLEGAAYESPTTAYVSLLSGRYKYLLGTQRDLYRMQTRGASYTAKLITSFNDMYQNISILCKDENYSRCLEFVGYIESISENVSSLGMISDKTQYAGVMGEMQSAAFEYTIKSFVGEDYNKRVNEAIAEADVNSLKNLLK